MANAYSNKGEHRKSLELFANTLKVLDELENRNTKEGKKYKSRVAYNAGFTAVKLGDIDSAVKYLSDANEIAVMGNDTLVQFFVLVQFGNVYLYRKDYDQALQYYKESYTLANQLSPHFAVFPMFGIGAAYQEMGELDSALVYNIRVLESQRESGNITSLCVILFNSAELFIDLERYDEAISLAKELMEYGLELGTNQHILNAANSLGRAYHLMGNTALAERIMIKYERYIDDDVEFDSAQKYYKMASAIAEEQGNIEVAYGYHKKYKMFSDSLLNQQSIARVDELNMKLETEQKRSADIGTPKYKYPAKDYQSTECDRDRSFACVTRIINVDCVLIYESSTIDNRAAKR
ncbi:MAG: tetratricopeptide (TPR) repeat protein [Saprospiraceae bacterium]